LLSVEAFSPFWCSSISLQRIICSIRARKRPISYT